jgi:hypothetical protein
MKRLLLGTELTPSYSEIKFDSLRRLRILQEYARGSKQSWKAKRLFDPQNEAQRQPAINIQITRAYLTATNPML